MFLDDNLPHLSVFQALKAANRMFSIEEIESIMDDTAEAVEKQREIDALLSGQGSPFGHFRNLETVLLTSCGKPREYSLPLLYSLFASKNGPNRRRIDVCRG